MKFTAFVITALMLAFTGLAQSPIKEKDLMGMWKFEFNLRESIDKEIDKDNPMAKALAEGLTGFVDALLGEIDIRFDFQKNNLLQIHVNVPMDNEKSVEKARWEITPNGAIRIMNIENGHVKINNSDEWILDDGKLFPKSEKGKSDKNVYLVKLK